MQTVWDKFKSTEVQHGYHRISIGYIHEYQASTNTNMRRVQSGVSGEYGEAAHVERPRLASRSHPDRMAIADLHFDIQDSFLELSSGSNGCCASSLIWGFLRAQNPVCAVHCSPWASSKTLWTFGSSAVMLLLTRLRY
jgi:hypothetical protein